MYFCIPLARTPNIYWSRTATGVRSHLTKFPSYRAVGDKFHLRECKWKLFSHRRRYNFIEQRSVGRIPWLPYELCERFNSVLCFLRHTSFSRYIPATTLRQLPAVQPPRKTLMCRNIFGSNAYRLVRLWTGRIGASITGKGKRVFSSLKGPDCSEAHPAPCLMGTAGNTLGCEVNHSFSSGAEFKNEWSYVSTPPYMPSWCALGHIFVYFFFFILVRI